MIDPVNDFILIDPIVDEKTKGGILLPGNTHESERPSKGVILEVGPGKYVDGMLEPMRMKKGQKILFQEYPFFEFSDKGRRVLLVRELQVVAVIS